MRSRRDDSASLVSAGWDRLSRDLSTARAEIDTLNDALKKAKALSADRDKTIASLQTGEHDTQAKLDAATAENAQLRTELQRLGKNADALLSQKGELATALADANPGSRSSGARSRPPKRGRSSSKSSR